MVQKGIQKVTGPKCGPNGGPKCGPNGGPKEDSKSGPKGGPKGGQKKDPKGGPKCGQIIIIVQKGVQKAVQMGIHTLSTPKKFEVCNAISPPTNDNN